MPDARGLDHASPADAVGAFARRVAAPLGERLYIGYLLGALAARRSPDAVFIWIPKTAGTALYHALRTAGCRKLVTLAAVRRGYTGGGMMTFGHMDYAGLVTAGLVPRAFDERAVKFAFVRNPYDRALSLYTYFTRRRGFFRDWKREPSLAEFVDLVRRGFVEDAGLYNRRGLSQANPQVRWLAGIDVDFVGRVERLDSDVARLAARLGTAIPTPGRHNEAVVPHSRADMTAEARQLVAETYADDFEAFGYEP